jgi:predicted RNA binding protein YcfA (HicA-like mRNA interferase family)
VNRLPIIKARQLVRALEKMGFRLLRKSKGSHWQFWHPDGRRTTVPMHKGTDIGLACFAKSCATSRFQSMIS